MENNQAVVTTLKNITAIPNADKIVQADVYLKDIKLTQVIVGVETKEDTLVVYFDSNVALSERLITDYPDLEKYLGKHGRVKAVKLRGIISNGLCVEVNHFTRYFSSDKEANKFLVEGTSFDKIGDIEICHKYIPPIEVHQHQQGKKKKKGKIISKMIPDQFNFHVDTKHLIKNIHVLQPNDIISISDKWHGCVSENTLIETLEFGKRTIGEIVKNKIQCNIKALDINTGKIIYVSIDQYYHIPNDGEWYEIELEDGNKIEITSNNPVWLPELNCYRRTDELKEGDSLLVDY